MLQIFYNRMEDEFEFEETYFNEKSSYKKLKIKHTNEAKSNGNCNLDVD